MNDPHDIRNLADLFAAITQAGNFGLAVLANPDASDVAKADASAVVDLTSRKLHELLQAIEDEDDD
jgi:hypothetical protein